MAKLTIDELKNVLKTEADFTDEQLTGLSKKQLEALADGYMRQSDYDRAMNDGKAEIKKAQDELEAANQRLNVEMAEWGKVQAEGGKVTKAMQERADRAEADVLRLTQTIQRVAGEVGLDASKLLGEITPPQPKPAPAAPDLSGYAKLDDVNTQLGALANMSLTLPATLFTLAQEHQSLFGSPLNAQAIVEEIKSRAETRGNRKSLDPRAIWEELNKVSDARKQAEDKRIEKIKSDEFERGRQAAISESAIPGQTTSPGRHSPVFGEQGRKSVLERPQPGQRVNAAAAALRSGKYREKSTA